VVEELVRLQAVFQRGRPEVSRAANRAMLLVCAYMTPSTLSAGI
jgi:hypothetical protein